MVTLPVFECLLCLVIFCHIRRGPVFDSACATVGLANAAAASIADHRTWILNSLDLTDHLIPLVLLLLLMLLRPQNLKLRHCTLPLDLLPVEFRPNFVQLALVILLKVRHSATRPIQRPRSRPAKCRQHLFEDLLPCTLLVLLR